MKLYKAVLQSAMLLLASGAFVSCDNIAEDDRFIPVEKEEIKRVALIQEFTGLWCTNCPQGAAAVSQIQEDYPGGVVAVNMHPENTTFTRPLNGLDLTCAEATVMYNYYNPTGFPAAVINGAAPNTFPNQWATLTAAALAETTPVGLEITTGYDEASRRLTVDYTVSFNDTFLPEASVMIWVVENGIKGWQIDGGRPNTDYTHNHVLRASVNGEWGEKLGSVFGFDDVVTGQASMVLDDAWVAENCEVVAYVFQTASKAVEQATIKHVISD